MTRNRTAGPDDVEALGLLLAAAFDEPVTRWLVPDRSRHAGVMSRFFAAVADDAIKTGAVDLLVDERGFAQAAALWFNRTHPVLDGPAPDGPAPDPRFDEIFGPDAWRWRMLDDVMTRSHPAEPHQYLMVIGVRPELQGRGLGARLLGDSHRRIGSWPAYLEATSLESRRLYLRLGYADLGEPLQLPGGPPMWPMWRPGRP